MTDKHKAGIGQRIGTVTRAGLKALRDQLARPSSAPELTIGGAAEEAVHSELDVAKRAALARGEQRLRESSAMAHRDHRLASLKGRSRSDLNTAVQQREQSARNAMSGKDQRSNRNIARERTR